MTPNQNSPSADREDVVDIQHDIQLDPEVKQYGLEEAYRRAKARIKELTNENITLLTKSEKLYKEKQEADKAREEAEKLSNVDSLTGAFTRRHLDGKPDAELPLAIDRCRRNWDLGVRTSVLMLDIDHFKTINDTRGHPMGDQALKQLVQIVKETLNRRSTDRIFRYGGEEFMIILENTDEDGAATVAEELRKAVESAVIPMDEGEPIRMTISTGVASFNPQDPDLNDPRNLVKSADAALYQAKKMGRNRVLTFSSTPTFSQPAEETPKPSLK